LFFENKFKNRKLILRQSKSLKTETIVLKPGPARRSTSDPADPGLEPGRVEEKIEEGKT
jgi:hypothetical protein